VKIPLLSPNFASDEHIVYFLIHCKLLNFIHKTVIVYVSSVTLFLSTHEMKKSSHLRGKTQIAPTFFKMRLEETDIFFYPLCWQKGLFIFGE